MYFSLVLPVHFSQSLMAPPSPQDQDTAQCCPLRPFSPISALLLPLLLLCKPSKQAVKVYNSCRKIQTAPWLEGIFSSLVLVTLELHLLLNIKFKLLFFTFRMFHNLLFLTIYHAVTEALFPLLISTGPILNYFKRYFLGNEIKLLKSLYCLI